MKLAWGPGPIRWVQVLGATLEISAEDYALWRRRAEEQEARMLKYLATPLFPPDRAAWAKPAAERNRVRQGLPPKVTPSLGLTFPRPVACNASQ